MDNRPDETLDLRAVLPFLALALVLSWGAPALAEELELPHRRDRAYDLWQEGYLLHTFGAYEEAIEAYRKSIEVRPTAEAHTFLGWSLSTLGRLDEAIGECKRAIALDPDFGNPYNDIGVYLIELGRPDEAVPWLQKAMRAGHYCCYAFPHFNMGRIELMRGRDAAAKRSFERALSYDPDHRPSLGALELLRRRELQTL